MSSGVGRIVSPQAKCRAPLPKCHCCTYKMDISELICLLTCWNWVLGCNAVCGLHRGRQNRRIWEDYDDVQVRLPFHEKAIHCGCDRLRNSTHSLAIHYLNTHAYHARQDCRGD